MVYVFWHEYEYKKLKSNFFFKFNVYHVATASTSRNGIRIEYFMKILICNCCLCHKAKEKNVRTICTSFRLHILSKVIIIMIEGVGKRKKKNERNWFKWVRKNVDGFVISFFFFSLIWFISKLHVYLL